MAPNNIDFFYAAEETSERIWRMDERLNTIYRYLVRVCLLGGSIAIGLHLKSKTDMRVAAKGVSTKIEKAGARAVMDEKGAVVVYMDGKV